MYHGGTAAKQSRLPAVQQLKSLPLCVLQLGTSPLHLAAQHGHYSTADVLLRAGVSRDARTKVDRTPLHMAAAEGHSVIVELLVRVGDPVGLVLLVPVTVNAAGTTTSS